MCRWLPIQILTNNLLYDFSQVPIPTDNVGVAADRQAPALEHGRDRQVHRIHRPISSIFDYTTYAVMWFVFKCNNLGLVPPPELVARFANAPDNDHTYAAALFHTGWFVESLITQTLIIHVIRTNLIPFIQSRSSWQLSMTTILIMVIGAVSAVYAAGGAAGVCSFAAALLADPAGNAVVLRRPDAGHQDVAGPQSMGVSK